MTQGLKVRWGLLGHADRRVQPVLLAKLDLVVTPVGEDRKVTGVLSGRQA